MKIIYAVECVNMTGGYDRIIIEKANYLAEHGHEVLIVVSYHGKIKPYYDISNKVKMIDLDINFFEQYNHNLFVRAIIYMRLMHRYRRLLTDLLKKERANIVITTLGREIDFITEINDGSSKVGESHIAKEYVRNLHLMEQRGLAYRIIARHWKRKLENKVRKLDSLVLLTQHDADSWAEIAKTVVIPNSIPFYPRQASTCENKQVIFVGRFNEQKGLEYLIKTWEGVKNKHQDWTLHMYGQGEQETLLRALIQKVGLNEYVKVHQPTRRILEKYMQSSIFLLTSRFEGLPMVLIEAMACGLPIVSFNCPWGPADIIKSGEDGFLVRYLNTDEATERVCQLIEDQELRKAMGAKARINVRRYERDVVMKQWMDLFNSLYDK